MVIPSTLLSDRYSIANVWLEFKHLDIGNPVAPPSREARVFSFTIEACRRTTKERLIDILERVDANNSIKTAVDAAGDDRHYAAPGASMKIRGSGTERVLGYERWIFDYYLENAGRIGGPHSAMFGAKRASASANRNFGGIRFPSEGEGDVPAVTFAVDQHTCDLRCCDI
jgi:hypothetical protein